VRRAAPFAAAGVGRSGRRFQFRRWHLRPARL